jgi:hypothetical protein
MPPITINRAPWGSLIDDSGQNLDGSLWDKAAIKTVLLDPIDVALAKVPIDVATGKLPDSALSTNVALLNRVNQQFSQQQIFAAVLQAVANLYADGGLIVRNIGIDLQAGALKFPAAMIASSDPNTQDDYEEGTWTPTDASGAGLAFTGAVGSYVKVGSKVLAGATLTYPSTAGAQQATIGGLPFPAIGSSNLWAGAIGYTAVNANHTIFISANTTTCPIFNASGAGVAVSVYSAKSLQFTIAYRTT